MKYYLAIDGGGTKTAAILYGEDLCRIGVCITGSLRANSTSPELVEKNAAELINSLGLTGLEIEELGGTCEQRIAEMIKSVCTVRRTGVFGELDIGLAAAGISGDGILALCGTGATVFARINGKKLFTGGYGYAVADEGSGFYIGRSACIAAIRDKEGRGERTLLSDMIPEHLGYAGKDELQQAIFSIYRRDGVSPVASVAGFVPVVIEAAKAGDAAAVKILEEAGRLLGEQTVYLIRSGGIKDDVPLTLSGSVWRGNPLLYNGFVSAVRSDCPSRRIVIPRLEPVAGVLAKRYYDKYGVFDDKAADLIRSLYPEFAYDINENKRR
ncbi:MAG: hypothetical protein J5879_02105 [Clostridia bacterium]|nr:hypothetical protein [Clostridia bacterium]